MHMLVKWDEFLQQNLKSLKILQTADGIIFNIEFGYPWFAYAHQISLFCNFFLSEKEIQVSKNPLKSQLNTISHRRKTYHIILCWSNPYSAYSPTQKNRFFSKLVFQSLKISDQALVSNQTQGWDSSTSFFFFCNIFQKCLFLLKTGYCHRYPHCPHLSILVAACDQTKGSAALDIFSDFWSN